MAALINGLSQSQRLLPDSVGELMRRLGQELSCPICLSILTEATCTPCSHHFCEDCINKALKNASGCPVCKTRIQRRSLNPSEQMRLLVQWFNRLAAAYEEMTGQSYDGDCKENLHEQGHERSDKQNDHCLNKQIDHFLEVSNEEAFSELEAFTALISDELERLNQKDKCNDENDLSLLQMIPSSPDPNLFASLRRPETDYSMAVCLTTSLIRREEDRNLITQFIFTFKEASIQDDFQDGQITHVIVGGDGGGGCRTLKSMLGILDGCWLVGMDWIRASLGAGQIVKEDSFEISSGSGRSRLSRSLGEAPLLFGMAIYLYGQFGRNLDQIRRLLLHAGATLIPDIDALVALDTGSTARRRRGSNRILVLCDPKEQGDFERDAGVIARFRPILDVSWLFESIASFQIADPRDHIVI